MNHEVPTGPVPALPVLTPDGLRLLTEDVGAETARAFLIAYLGLLSGRADAIVDKLGGGDVDGAREAVSSLHATSSMAGALRLEDYCQSLQEQLSAGPIPLAGTVKVELDENVRLLSRAIPELLSTPVDGQHKESIASSESYKSKASALSGIGSVKKNASSDTVDLTGDNL